MSAQKPIDEIQASKPPGESPSIWNNQQAELYLKGIEQSDYADNVGSRLLELIGPQTQLLDIGAGVGTISRKILTENAGWTAIEPNAFLVDQLTANASSWPYQLSVLPYCWQQLNEHELEIHDVSLAANTSGPMYDTKTFWHWQQSLTRRLMIWIVPAQNGPHGKCLSGFLPEHLHGEKVGSTLEASLEQLGPAMQPDTITMVDWTFRQSFADYQQANHYFQNTFNPSAEPRLKEALSKYLDEFLQSDGNAFFATAAKKSAVLIWHFN